MRNQLLIPDRAPWYVSADGAVQLYQGHAEVLLPALPAGVAGGVITDPPYSSGGLFKGDRAADPVRKYCQNNDARGRSTFTGDNRDQRSFGWWAAGWLRECLRITRPGGYVMVFTDWRQLPTITDAIQAAGWVWRGILTWDKGAGARAPHKGYFRHQAEFIAWGSNGGLPAATHGGPWPGVFPYPTLQRDKFHVTGKPTPLLSDLVQAIPPGELIVDPFGGSMTTAVAAAGLGRRCLAVELEAVNLDIGAARLSDLAITPAEAPADA